MLVPALLMRMSIPPSRSEPDAAVPSGHDRDLSRQIEPIHWRSVRVLVSRTDGAAASPVRASPSPAARSFAGRLPAAIVRRWTRRYPTLGGKNRDCAGPLRSGYSVDARNPGGFVGRGEPDREGSMTIQPVNMPTAIVAVSVAPPFQSVALPATGH